ncbi:MAG: hypothetical protein R3B70_36370 [Polyangiaceae bacterium]
MDVLEQQACGLVGGEGGAAGEHLEGGDPEGVLIGAVAHGLAHGLLGGHVLRGSEDGACGGEGGAAFAEHGRADLGDAEVDDLDGVALGERVVDDDVFGLEIAVDDALFVGAGEGGGDLAEDGDGALGREPSGGDVEHGAEGDAVDVLHHEVEIAVGGAAEVAGLGDVGVAEVGGGDGLALEAGDDLLARALAGGEELEGDLLAQGLVHRLVDGAHAALAELADNAVPTGHEGADERVGGGALFGGLVSQRLHPSKFRGALSHARCRPTRLLPLASQGRVADAAGAGPTSLLPSRSAACRDKRPRRLRCPARCGRGSSRG